jgi:TP901 family phage tail tape measure protein
MADEIRIPVSADTTPMLRDIENVASKARVSIRANLDSKQLEAFSRPLGKITGQADEFTKSMEAANARVLAFGASVGVVNALANGFKNLIASTIEVEKSLNEIKVIGNDTFSNLDQVSKGLFSTAKQLGVSYKDAANATLEFARQGKDLQASLEASRAALTLTRTTGLDAAESVKGLTSAVNVFSESGLTYADIVNKMSAVDSKFAVNSKDLIEGISRSASVAQEAGVSFDELTALITTLQEKTGRGGAVIGNALKTIFTRVQNPEILKDIRDLGIAVTDTSGNFLPATRIIQSLANEFEGLDANVRKNILLKVGGGFQIDKLAAALNDMANANGTFQRSLQISQSNVGNAFDKVTKLNQTVDGAFNNVLSSAKEAGSLIGRIAFSEDFRKILEGGSSFFDAITGALGGNNGEEGLSIGQTLARGIVKGIGSVITGPGLFLFAGILIKLTADFAKFSTTAIQTQLGITSKGKEQEAIQKSISTVLSGNTDLQVRLLNLEGNKVEQAAVLLDYYNRIAASMERQKNLSKDLSDALYEGGVRLGSGKLEIKSGGSQVTKTAAGGYVPNLASAIATERAQSPTGSKILVDHNFPMGGGQKGTMVYNSNETRIRNFAGTGGDAIIPNYPVSAAFGYTPNFAKQDDIEKDKNKIKKLAVGGKGQLDIDARSIGVAGITMGGVKPVVNGKSLEINDKLLKNYIGSPFFDKLKEYDRISLQNVDSGAVYRFRQGLKDNEGSIASDFVSRLNRSVRPQILDFIQVEMKALGLKPGGGLNKGLEGLNFNIMTPSSAGYVLEEIIKAPTLTTADKVAEYAAQNEKAYFDIQNLSSEYAEAYGLPKKDYNYVDVKSSENELERTITRKFLNQAMYEGGGTALRNAAKGYVPNFADKQETFLISKKMSEFGNIESKQKADPVDQFSSSVKIIRQDKTIKDYGSEANSYIKKIYPEKNNGKINLNQLNKVEKLFRDRGASETSLKTFRSTLTNSSNYGSFNSTIKGILGELDAKELIGKNIKGSNSVFDFAGYVDARTRRVDDPTNILIKGVNFWLRNKSYVNKKEDKLSLPSMTAIVPADSKIGIGLNYQNAAKGYIPNFANTSNMSGAMMRFSPKYAGGFGLPTMTGSEAVASLSETKGTRLKGTNFGEKNYRTGGFELDENNIIASILGNNTFFQAGVSQASMEKDLGNFIERLTAGDRIIGGGAGGAYAGVFGSGMRDIQPKQIISANISGKFKNIDYSKLEKIFPRLWRAKGVESAWDMTKGILALTGSEYSSSYDTPLFSKYNKIKSDEVSKNVLNLRSYTEALRNVAIASVADYDKDLLGFHINIAGTEDEAIMKSREYNSKNNTSYIMPFGSRGITNPINVGMRQEHFNDINKSLPPDLKKMFHVGGSTSYGSFTKWFDTNQVKFAFKSKKQAQDELAMALNIKGINYDAGSKQMIFEPFIAKTASKGYRPNFANSIENAVVREKMATGLPESMIKVSTDSRAIHPILNPTGQIVTNKIDEPNGASDVTPDRMKNAYRNASRGFVPNFTNGVPAAVGLGDKLGVNIPIQPQSTQQTQVESVLIQAIKARITQLNKSKEEEQKLINVIDSYSKQINENYSQAQKNLKNNKDLDEAEKALLKKILFEAKNTSNTTPNIIPNNAPNSSPNAAPNVEQKNNQVNKATEDTKKSFGDLAQKAFIFQSGLSFATGALSSFGKETEDISQAISSFGQLIYTATQGLALLSTVNKGRGIKELTTSIAPGFATGAAGKTGFSRITSGIAGALKGTAAVPATEGAAAVAATGLGGGTAIGAATAALSITAATGAIVYALYKGADALSQVYLQSAKKTAAAIAGMNEILEKYGSNAPQLTENQKNALERFKKTSDTSGAGFSAGSNTFTNLFRFATQNVGTDTTYKTKYEDELKKLNLTSEGNVNFAKMFGPLIAPLAEQQATKIDKNGKEIIDTEKFDVEMTDQAIKIIDRIAQVREKILSSYEPTAKELKKAQFSEMGLYANSSPEEIRKVALKNKSSEYTAAAMQDVYKEILPESKKAEADQNFKKEAILFQTEILKKQLDINIQIAKVQSSIPSFKENQLAIEKDLLKTSIDRKIQIDLELKSLESQKQLASDIRDQLGRSANESIGKYLDRTSSLGVAEPKKEEILALNSKLASSTNPKQGLEIYAEILDFIDRGNISLDEKLKKENDLLETLKKQREQNKSNEDEKTSNDLNERIKKQELIVEKIGKISERAKQDLDLQRSQASLLEKQAQVRDQLYAKDILNKTIQDQINSAYSMRKDMIVSVLTNEQKSIDLAQKQLDIQNRISDAKFKTSLINSSNPNEDPFIAQRKTQLREINLPAQRESIAYEMEKQRALIADKQSMVSLASQRGGTLDQLTAITNAKTFEDAQTKLAEVIDQEGTQFENAVKLSANYFLDTIKGASVILSQSITGELEYRSSFNKFGIAGQEVAPSGFYKKGTNAQVTADSFISDITKELENRSQKTLETRVSGRYFAGNIVPKTEIVNPTGAINEERNNRLQEFNQSIRKRFFDFEAQRMNALIAGEQKALEYLRQRITDQEKLKDLEFEGKNLNQFNPFEAEKASARYQIEKTLRDAKNEDLIANQTFFVESKNRAFTEAKSRGATPEELQGIVSSTNIDDIISKLQKVIEKNIDETTGTPGEQLVSGAKQARDITIDSANTFRKIISGDKTEVSTPASEPRPLNDASKKAKQAEPQLPKEKSILPGSEISIVGDNQKFSNRKQEIESIINGLGIDFGDFKVNGSNLRGGPNQNTEQLTGLVNKAQKLNIDLDELADEYDKILDSLNGKQEISESRRKEITKPKDEKNISDTLNISGILSRYYATGNPEGAGPVLKEPGAKKASDKALENQITKEENQTKFERGFKSGIGQIDESVQKFDATLGQQIPKDFAAGMKDALKELSNPNSTQPLKTRLLGVALAFTQKIQDAFLTQATNKFTSSIFGGNGFFGGANGMADGGPVIGGSGAKDDVPMMLMGGEYVVKKSAVDKYGHAYLDALNHGSVMMKDSSSRRSAGGLIPGDSALTGEVPALLMGGEYVLDKTAVKKYGLGYLSGLNKGKVQKFADGGPVGWNEADITKWQDPAKTSPYGQYRNQGLSFDQNGSVVGMDTYKGTAENKQNELRKAQSNYYAQNAQSGEGGFYMPGQNGMGAIMGQRNLLSFATQQTAGTQFDRFSGGANSAGVDLGAGSANMSLFALRDEGNSRNASYLQAKQKSLDLYLGGIDATKEKANKEHDILEEQKRIKEEAEKREKEMYKGMLVSLGVSVGMAGLGALASSASTGWSAAGQAAAAEGRTATFGEKFQGAFTGGTMDGQNRGGIANMFSSSGYKDFSVIGDKSGSGLQQFNSKTNQYERMASDDFRKMYGSGKNLSYDSMGTPYKSSNTFGYSWNRKASGGSVYGNGMGDNVPTMLNGGEFVISKQAAQNVGVNKLQQINSGGKAEDSSELLLAKLDELVEKLSAVGTLNITVNSDSNGKQSEKQEGGGRQDQQTKDLAKKIKEVVMNVLKEEKRLGGMLR